MPELWKRIGNSTTRNVRGETESTAKLSTSRIGRETEGEKERKPNPNQ